MTERAEMSQDRRLVSLDVAQPIWDRFFLVAPLVVVGTREPDGGYDLAPKHMVLPLGWQNYVGFVCTPRHATHANILREGAFTMSWLAPGQEILASLAAAPRAGMAKPQLGALETFPAEGVDGVFVRSAYLFLECALDRTVDGFGENSLVVGRVTVARLDAAALRMLERDDNEVLRDAPLLAYLQPGRFARIARSDGFPFPLDFCR